MGAARDPVPLPQGQHGVRRLLPSGQLLGVDAGGGQGEPGGLRQEGGRGHGGHVGAEGEDGGVQRLQGLLPQLVERGGAHLATAAASLMAPGRLELLEQEGCISRVLQGKDTETEGCKRL